MTHELATALNRHRQVDMAILDLSKALDKVPHQCLQGILQHFLWHLWPFEQMD